MKILEGEVIGPGKSSPVIFCDTNDAGSQLVEPLRYFVYRIARYL